MRQRSELHNLLNIAVSVAQYYGFRPMDDVVAMHVPPAHEVENRSVDERKQARNGYHMRQRHVFSDASIFDLCIQGSIVLPLPAPILTYAFSSRSHAALSPYQASGGLTFEVLGAQGSVAEALLMHAMHAAVVEAGLRGTMVMNSVGDRVAFAKFRTDCMNYYRRRYRDLHAPCREAFTNHLEKIFECQNDHCIAIRENAPRTMDYLNESSRRHLKEVLEYLELLHIPYYIDDQMVAAADPESNVETVFALYVEYGKDETASPRNDGDDSRSLFSGAPLIYGGRREKKSLNGRERVHEAYATIAVNTPRARGHFREEPQKEKCKAHFVQFGPEARRKNFFVLETLRRMHIPVSYSLVEVKLGEALRHAEERSIPFTIIMGQKEAMSDSVIVRRTETRAQETVSLSLLPAYLKHAR